MLDTCRMKKIRATRKPGAGNVDVVGEKVERDPVTGRSAVALDSSSQFSPTNFEIQHYLTLCTVFVL